MASFKLRLSIECGRYQAGKPIDLSVTMDVNVLRTVPGLSRICVHSICICVGRDVMLVIMWNRYMYFADSTKLAVNVNHPLV